MEYGQWARKQGHCPMMLGVSARGCDIDSVDILVSRTHFFTSIDNNKVQIHSPKLMRPQRQEWFSFLLLILDSLFHIQKFVSIRRKGE